MEKKNPGGYKKETLRGQNVLLEITNSTEEKKSTQKVEYKI